MEDNLQIYEEKLKRTYEELKDAEKNVENVRKKLFLCYDIIDELKKKEKKKILDLPNELLLKIFSYTSPMTIVNQIHCTCKRFRNIVNEKNTKYLLGSKLKNYSKQELFYACMLKEHHAVMKAKPDRFRVNKARFFVKGATSATIIDDQVWYAKRGPFVGSDDKKKFRINEIEHIFYFYGELFTSDKGFYCLGGRGSRKYIISFDGKNVEKHYIGQVHGDDLCYFKEVDDVLYFNGGFINKNGPDSWKFNKMCLMDISKSDATLCHTSKNPNNHIFQDIVIAGRGGYSLCPHFLITRNFFGYITYSDFFWITDAGLKKAVFSNYCEVDVSDMMRGLKGNGISVNTSVYLFSFV